MLATAAARLPNMTPQASVSMTRTHSTDRTTSPGNRPAANEFCWKQSSEASPLRHAARRLECTEPGPMIHASEVSGPAWMRDVAVTTGPSASTKPIAPKMRRFSRDELYCQCHRSDSCGRPAIAVPISWPATAAMSVQ